MTDHSSHLTDLLRLCQVDPAWHRDELVEIAQQGARTDEGWGPAVDDLAALGAAAGRVRFAELVQACVTDLGLDVLSGPELQDRAVAAQCRRLLDGRLTERELTYWVTRVVGLRGSSHVQTFLSFEDEYTRFAAYDCSEIDRDVREAAEQFVEPVAPVRRRGLFRRR